MPVIPRSRVGLMPAPTPSSGAGLFWWPKYDRSRYHHAGGKAHCGDQPPRKLKIIKNVNNFLYSPYGLCYLLLVVTTRFALHLKSYPKQKNSVLQSNRYCIISVPSPVMMEHMIDACWLKLISISPTPSWRVYPQAIPVSRHFIDPKDLCFGTSEFWTMKHCNSSPFPG